MDNSSFKEASKKAQQSNKDFYRKLKARPPKDLDRRFHEAHDQVFSDTDCLQCANCCKTTSPIFYERDIDRASRALRLKPRDFIDKYLRIDEDKDYVLQKSPCAFLGHDNLCSIYDDRPQACREYPHTNRKRMHQILDLTYRNTLVCPAVLRITGLIQAELEL
jgi:Fe-S-cluster containining protein